MLLQPRLTISYTWNHIIFMRGTFLTEILVVTTETFVLGFSEVNVCSAVGVGIFTRSGPRCPSVCTKADVEHGLNVILVTMKSAQNTKNAEITAAF